MLSNGSRPREKLINACHKDNVHARDYSLHDIHSLHIHSNLSGPLRLRLQIVGPRFTIRYQQLQSELVAFSTKEGQEKSDVAAAASHGEVQGYVP